MSPYHLAFHRDARNLLRMSVRALSSPAILAETLDLEALINVFSKWMFSISYGNWLLTWQSQVLYSLFKSIMWTWRSGRYILIISIWKYIGQLDMESNVFCRIIRWIMFYLFDYSSAIDFWSCIRIFCLLFKYPCSNTLATSVCGNLRYHALKICKSMHKVNSATHISPRHELFEHCKCFGKEYRRSVANQRVLLIIFRKRTKIETPIPRVVSIWTVLFISLLPEMTYMNYNLPVFSSRNISYVRCKEHISCMLNIKENSHWIGNSCQAEGIAFIHTHIYSYTHCVYIKLS